MALFLESFSGGSKVEYKLSERGRSLELFCEAWMLGVKMAQNSLRRLF
jgi:DNA-binding HxlR family transcriptional regulator